MHAEEEREWQTRKKRIDTRLEAQGWKVVPFDAARSLDSYKCHAIREFPTDNGPADYVLVSNGRILGVVEAKKLSLGPQNVLLQAERYSRALSESPFNFDGLHAPFLYATNGEVLWFHVAAPISILATSAANYARHFCGAALSCALIKIKHKMGKQRKK